MFEKKYGTAQKLQDILARATKACPNKEKFWLMAATTQWKANKDIAEARGILQTAFIHNENSENIWLSAYKLESEHNEMDRARKLLKKAREKANTRRIWMKSAKLEWQLNNLKQAKVLLEEALVKYPDFYKLYLMKGQILESLNNYEKAHETYLEGTKKCPADQILWIHLSRNELKSHGITKARSTLERALNKNPDAELIWKENVLMEMKHTSRTYAKQRLARAQQQLPTSGQLWALAIGLASRPERKTVGLQALRKCPDSQEALIMVARMFMTDRKIQKAREWFHRALKVDNNNGDVWALLYKFELDCGNKDKSDEVYQRCIHQEPKYGHYWTKVAKDIKNWRMKTKEILDAVVKIIPDQLK